MAIYTRFGIEVQILSESHTDAGYSECIVRDVSNPDDVFCRMTA